MRARLQEQQRQLHVILLPRHQPVRLYVALPLSVHVARQLVWTVLCGQRACSSKQRHSVLYKLHVQTALLATFQVFLETLGVVDAIHISQVFA